MTGEGRDPLGGQGAVARDGEAMDAVEGARGDGLQLEEQLANAVRLDITPEFNAKLVALLEAMGAASEESPSEQSDREAGSVMSFKVRNDRGNDGGSQQGEERVQIG